MLGTGIAVTNHINVNRMISRN